MNEPDQRKRRGSRADRKGDPFEWVVVGLVFFCLVLMVVAVSVAASVLGSFSETVDRVQRGVDEIREVEKTSQDASRATAFRLCSRNAVDRAFAQSFTPPGPERRKLQSKHGIPILDCEPNLRGLGAQVLSHRDQDVFVRRWVTRNLSDVERGICPGSRFDDKQSSYRC